MDAITLKKIEDFSKIASSMSSSFKTMINEWSPEIPPLTIMFAAMGNSFIDKFNENDSEENQKVFSAVETMLTGENEELNIGASTGFLEAIATKPGFDKTVKAMLGKESRSFLKSWNQFMGIQDKDL